MASVSTTPKQTPRATSVAWLRDHSLATNLGVIGGLLAALSIYAITDGGFGLYLQRVFNGFSSGVLYGATALALVLVFKATKVINFGQGAMATFGAYLAYTCINNLGIPVVPAIVIAMIASAFMAAGIERTLIRPFDPNNHLAILLVTLGVYIALSALTILIWGSNPHGFPNLISNGSTGYISIAGARLYYEVILEAVVVGVFVLAIVLILSRTRLGLAMRCVASSVESARLLGINVGRSIQTSWALAAAAGTLAACLSAPSTFIQPGFMDNVLLYAFAAATLGGLDSIVGSVFAGVLVGITTSLLTGYVPAFGAEFGSGVAFLLIVIVLQIKPAGLFGRHVMERV
jgi:branched-chain amino acid transport system permease protein